MLKIGLVVLLILMAGRNYAQEEYFVLIQSDNNQPFYAHVGERSFSSSPQGHLIIPQLRDSPYLVVIGFPKQLYPELAFSFLIKGDHGFQLRNLDDRGWGLADMQTQELKMPEQRNPVAGKSLRGVRKDDAFSRLMAGVVSDTAVMYNTYAMEEILKDSVAPGSSAISSPGPPDHDRSDHKRHADSSNRHTANILRDSSNGGMSSHPVDPPGSLPMSAPVPADTAKLVLPARTDPTFASSSGKPDSPAVPPDPAVAAPSRAALATPPSTEGVVPVHTPGTVVKLSERKMPRSLRLAFADHTKGRKTDTIIVYIPLDTAGMTRPASPSNGSPAPAGLVNPGSQIAGLSRSGSNPNPSNPNPSNSNPSNPGSSNIVAAPALPPAGSPPGSVQTAKPGAATTTPSRLPFINSDCKNYATDYDVDKLRVKMLESGKDEDRITIARKAFRAKCVSSRQVKALCEIFTTDVFKFKFLEAAYPFVSDDRFRELSELLADPVYNSRFKSMTGQH